MGEDRFYETPAAGLRRSAPAALRNRQPIADVLARWLPSAGLVLELASGTGEHVAYFAERFRELTWQPSDISETAIESIAAWRRHMSLPNLRPPLRIDAGGDWPDEKFDAILCINMAHISPWRATETLVKRATAQLNRSGALILYGPWIRDDVPTAASNLAFDADLKSRNPAWGLRQVKDLQSLASRHDLVLREAVPMPANNLMLLLRTDAK